MELGGTWRVAPADDAGRRSFPDPELDDAGWASLDVPGHWRSAVGLGDADGPVFHRRSFDAAAPAPGRRAWLVFEGVCYQGDVWLDGSYVGDTEGWFAPHTFEVTDALRDRRSHLLAVEVACPPLPEVGSPRQTLTGALQGGSGVDDSWNPGGIWAPVRLEESGPVRIASLRVTCPDARPEVANLDVQVELDATTAGQVPFEVVVRDGGGEVVARRRSLEAVAAGSNRVRRRVTVDRPRLWWPHAMGEQPLHDVEVTVGDGVDGTSDRRTVRTGLRQVRVRGLVTTVNGERIYLKGCGYGPTGRALADVAPGRVEADVALAVDAGLDLLRVQGHIGRPELYSAADRAGLLLWQDLPLVGPQGPVRRQAVRQARQAVTLLAHHPSVLLWCGHDEPVPAPADGSPLRWAASQAVPSWSRATLDRSVRRALERADGSRPVLGRSGALPHPAWATDAHLSYGWRRGGVGDLAVALRRVPVLARFVGVFGAQAVPDSDRWIDASAWPDLDWDHLARSAGADVATLLARVPPGGRTYPQWRDATQAHQAVVLRRSVEMLRRLKYRPTGGFCAGTLADAQPAVSASVVDHLRRPKAAYRALAEACAPVIVTAELPAARYRPGEGVSLPLHVVSDRRSPLLGAELRATVAWEGGTLASAWATPRVPADSVVRVGRLEFTSPPVAGPVHISLELRWDGGRATNAYITAVELG